MFCETTMNPSSAEKSLRKHRKSWNAVLPLKSKRQSIVIGIVSPVRFSVDAAVPGSFQERKRGKTEASIKHGAVLKRPSMDFQKRIRRAIKSAVQSTNKFVTRILC